MAIKGNLDDLFPQPSGFVLIRVRGVRFGCYFLK